jgi:hypothetical protein
MPNIFGVLGDKVHIDAELVKKLDCNWILLRMKLKPVHMKLKLY